MRCNPQRSAAIVHCLSPRYGKLHRKTDRNRSLPVVEEGDAGPQVRDLTPEHTLSAALRPLSSVLLLSALGCAALRRLHKAATIDFKKSEICSVHVAASNLWISKLLYFIGFALRMPAAEFWLYDYDQLAANELALRCSALLCWFIFSP